MYCINKQTRVRAHVRPRRASRALAPVIRTCTYTSPRNKPRRRRERVDARTRRGCVCLENKNASFETCIPNSYPPPLALHLLAVPLYPCRVQPPSRAYLTIPALPRPAIGHLPPRSPPCRFSRIFLPASETSLPHLLPHPVPPTLAVFFVSSCIWFRDILAIARACDPTRERLVRASVRATPTTQDVALPFIDTASSLYALSFYSAAVVFQERSHAN